VLSIAIAVIAWTICPAFISGHAATRTIGASAQQSQNQTDEGLPLPKIELKGKLSEIFTVTHCEYISGLTCRIHYNGKLPLPSRVFFNEFDQRGQSGGPRVRLIYPELKSGETGRATFRTRLGRPAKIVLEGEWKGPWQDPY
jgi:hypothetical protein